MNRKEGDKMSEWDSNEKDEHIKNMIQAVTTLATTALSFYKEVSEQRRKQARETERKQISDRLMENDARRTQYSKELGKVINKKKLGELDREDESLRARKEELSDKE